MLSGFRIFVSGRYFYVRLIGFSNPLKELGLLNGKGLCERELMKTFDRLYGPSGNWQTM